MVQRGNVVPVQYFTGRRPGDGGGVMQAGIVKVYNGLHASKHYALRPGGPVRYELRRLRTLSKLARSPGGETRTAAVFRLPAGQQEMRFFEGKLP
jgi:hypothetical protein